MGAVAAASAALRTSSGASSAGAFDDAADFVAHNVFARGAALRTVPVRLVVGDRDPFVAGNRAFARKVPTAALTVDPGGHTPDYWRSHAGAQRDWLAARCRADR